MKRLAFVILLAATPAAAQNGPSPNEQALGAKLMKEINDGLQCSANVSVLQAEITKLQAKIKELEASPDTGKK